MTTLHERICPDCRERTRIITKRRMLADEIARRAIAAAREGCDIGTADEIWPGHEYRAIHFAGYARGILDARRP